MSFKFKGLSPATKMRSRRLYDSEVKRTAESALSLSLIESFLALACETLSDEFGFGDKRLNQFKDRLESKLDCINSELVSFEDIKENLSIQTIVVKDRKIYKIEDDIRELKEKEIKQMKARKKRA